MCLILNRKKGDISAGVSYPQSHNVVEKGEKITTSPDVLLLDDIEWRKGGKERLVPPSRAASRGKKAILRSNTNSKKQKKQEQKEI